MKKINWILALYLFSLSSFAECLNLAGVYAFTTKEQQCRGDLAEFLTPYDDEGVELAPADGQRINIILPFQNFQILQTDCNYLAFLPSSSADRSPEDPVTIFSEQDPDDQRALFSTTSISAKYNIKGTSFFGTPQKWFFEYTFSRDKEQSLKFQVRRSVRDYGVFTRSWSYTCIFPRV